MAVSLTAEALARVFGAPVPPDEYGETPTADDAANDAARLQPVAAAIVDRYAPAAPVAVANEATIRLAAWLRDTPQQERSINTGDLDTEYWSRTGQSALRASGAQALLRCWRVRRVSA